MKKTIFFAILLVVFSTDFFAQSVQDFTVVNNTGVLIYDLYVTPADAEEWGEDILGVETLEDGASVDISFSGYSDSTCLWDVMIGDTEGNYFWLEDVDLCTVFTLTFTSDNRK